MNQSIESRPVLVSIEFVKGRLFESDTRQGCGARALEYQRNQPIGP